MFLKLVLWLRRSAGCWDGTEYKTCGFGFPGPAGWWGDRQVNGNLQRTGQCCDGENAGPGQGPPKPLGHRRESEEVTHGWGLRDRGGEKLPLRENTC